MKVTDVQGDILESDADLIVIPVNQQGVFGAGLAKQFKDEYPELVTLYQEYLEDAYEDEHKLAMVRLIGSPIFMMFPTKVHWKDKSSLKDIGVKLDIVFDMLKDSLHHPDTGILPIRHVAIPMLGAGLGGLHNEDVYSMIRSEAQRHAEETGREIFIYIGR